MKSEKRKEIVHFLTTNAYEKETKAKRPSITIHGNNNIVVITEQHEQESKTRQK